MITKSYETLTIPRVFRGALKIDCSLTQSILTDHRSMVLMESIITVAKELEAKTVVEFVCSKELFDVVREMGVDHIQGYHIGVPKKEIALICP